MPLFVFVPLLCSGLIFYVGIFHLKVFHVSETILLPRFVGQLEKNNINGFLIKTEGCRIPVMDPFDPAIIKYISKEKPVVCNSNKPALMESNLTSIYLLNTSLVAYEIQDITALNCSYSSFKRVESSPNEDDHKVSFEKCVKFNNTAKIDTEFVRVICTYNGKKVYTDFFAFVPLKSKFKNLPSASSQKLNVLIVGLDGVSRVNLHRQMPKTVKMLQKLGAIEFLGYTKVADNSFPNLIPLLTGLSEQELVEKCWHQEYDKFDNCTFLWNYYSKNGFATSFGEDCTGMGTFNHFKRGFIKQPTDYLWGTFNYVAESEIGNEHAMYVNQCIGSREVYRLLLDYIINYATIMEQNKIPHFSFFWGTTLSHDYLNKPQLGDDYYVKFFNQLLIGGVLKNTVLVFMSDHGIRYGDIRETYQGRMEERLPFLFLNFPETYQDHYNAILLNLKRNVMKLTSPFDLHETLKDLLSPFSLSENVINNRVLLRKGNERAYSLFEPIPDNRTCASSGISSHWCACQVSTVISINESVVVDGANSAVQHLNSLLKGNAECANLSLAEIYNARVHSVETHLQGNSYTLDYTIGFRTEPGDGNFEATVRRIIIEKNKNSDFKVVGTISRINSYGSQSRCVSDFHLKLYCYCVT